MYNIIVSKRDGRKADFDENRITEAIKAAMQAVNVDGIADYHLMLDALEVKDDVVYDIRRRKSNDADQLIIGVEEIQDIVEECLIRLDYAKAAKAYILYREQRSRVRNHNSDIMSVMRKITYSAAIDSDIKRENGNINADSPMGAMLKYGTEISKQFAHEDLLCQAHSKAHMDGDIHIHDLDFYATGTLTCTQIDIVKLFKSGFSTGHGYLREPGSIRSYAALACIAIQANQNDQHLRV